MLAVLFNKKEIVEALIKESADFDAADKKGQTALMRAAWCGNIDIVALLEKAMK